MRMNSPNPQPKTDLRQLCPNLSEPQLAEADDNLRRYVAFALRVFERLELDPEALAQFEALTASRRQLRMNHEKPKTQAAKL
jgi:hypothetical protein